MHAKQIVKLLKEKDLTHKVIDLKAVPDDEKSTIILALQMDTGYQQLPSIFFGEEHIGGIDDLRAYLSCDESIQHMVDKTGVTMTQSLTEPNRLKSTSDMMNLD